ncbi:MAG: Fe-S cluster assembly protein SufD [Calditrichaeota bacterium]|nr:Fe-S cluster assembly protein SufD [Calditrichota bacterium]
MLNRIEVIKQIKAQFNRFQANLNGFKDHSINEVRKQALITLDQIGLPTLKDEEWRFTDLDPLFERQFQTAGKDIAEKIDPEEIRPFLYADFPGLRLVFVDGHFAARLSTQFEEDGQLQIKSLKEYFNRDSSRLKEILGDRKIVEHNAFAALNTAFLSDGLYIEIPDKTVLDAPVNILYLSSDRVKNQANHVRNVIKLGKNSQARVIETYLSMDQSPHFTNTLTTVKLEERARLIHTKIQNESLNAFHVGNIIVELSSGCRYVSNNIALGGFLVRNNIDVRLGGENSEAVLNGLYMGHKNQHIDNNTLIDHGVPNCESHELYQGILNDSASAVFSGKILVRPDAQKTDAVQSNNCLLLSDEARIDSKPQLEIYADDVRCTHGATVGQLDEDAVFYLRSRGISEQRAKNLLIYSFARKIIEQIKVESVREFVDEIILQRFKEDMNFTK